MKSGRSNPKVIVLLVGLVVVVAYLLVWRPRVAEVADAQANRDALTAQLAQLDAAFAASATPTTVPASALAGDVAIPPTAELPGLLRQLQQVAADAGVAQTSVSPSPPVANGGVPGATIAVTVSASGSKAAVYDYVHRLGTLKRLFVVDKVSLLPVAADGVDPTVGAFQLELSGRVFTTATKETADA
jgi:Tfp pilus assembly protein PilO